MSSFSYTAVRLRDVESLTFTKGLWTTNRRTQKIPQLNCVGGACEYMPLTALCRNVGFDGRDVVWECTADLPSHIKFGSVQVNCEGYNYPEDQYVLSGSCGLEYILEVDQAELKKMTSKSQILTVLNNSVRSSASKLYQAFISSLSLFGPLLLWGAFALLCYYVLTQFGPGGPYFPLTDIGSRWRRRWENSSRGPPGGKEPPHSGGFRSYFYSMFPSYYQDYQPYHEPSRIWSGLLGGVLGYLLGRSKKETPNSAMETATSQPSFQPSTPSYETSNTVTKSTFATTKRRENDTPTTVPSAPPITMEDLSHAPIPSVSLQHQPGGSHPEKDELSRKYPSYGGTIRR